MSATWSFYPYAVLFKDKAESGSPLDAMFARPKPHNHNERELRVSVVAHARAKNYLVLGSLNDIVLRDGGASMAPGLKLEARRSSPLDAMFARPRAKTVTITRAAQVSEVGHTKVVCACACEGTDLGTYRVTPLNVLAQPLVHGNLIAGWVLTELRAVRPCRSIPSPPIECS
jgi:hypothetical protein